MFENMIMQAQTIAIGGHVRPDGDCVGSCMGLYQYIRNSYPEKEVTVYLQSIPDSFYMFPVVNEITQEIKEEKEYDLFIALDCGDARRLDFSEPLFHKAKHTFCIDHHVSNLAFAEENYIIPDASSTAELVYQLLDKSRMCKEIAECLFLGIVHDTGVFQYTCTAPETMEVAADLMRYGIESTKIIEQTFYEKTYIQNKVLGYALLNSHLLADGKCIYSCISKAVMDEYHATSKDLDSIVSQLRITQGTEVAIFLYSLSEEEYKVSLRSNGAVDVSKIAVAFDGGGHAKAAGASVSGKPEEILNNLMIEINKQL